MKSYKEYIINQFKGRRVRFLSDCVAKFEITGTVVDTESNGSEIIYIVDVGGKLLKVGENTPKLMIDFV